MATLVTLEQFKDFSRMGSGSTNNAIMQAFLDGAEEWIGRYLGVAFTVASFTEYLDGGARALRPDVRPIVAVTELRDMAFNSALDPSGYEIEDQAIVPPVATTLADVQWARGNRRWKLTYTAGYNNGNADPKPAGSIAAPLGLKLPIMALGKRAWLAGEGAQIQSAAKIFTNYDNLASGEIVAMLQPYRLGGWF